MIDLLVYMYGKSDAQLAFYESMARAGISGTLSKFKNPKLEAADLRAKSGSLHKTITYVGYFTNKKGERLAFSIMFNKYDVPYRTLKKYISEIFDVMVTY